MKRKPKRTKEEQEKYQKNQRLYNTYGLTLDEYNEMLKEQSYACWICGKKYPRLCVDHRHVAKYKRFTPEQKRKEVRGILCFLCNTGLKGFDKTKDGKENRNRLEGTYRYFQKFKLKGEE